MVTIFAIAIALLAAAPASAAIFTVNQITDESDATPGDNLCDWDTLTTGDQCTLRAAIEESNSGAGADTILFSLPSSSTITPTLALPDITNTLGIAGPGATDLTVSGNTAHRVLKVDPNTSVSVSSLTLAHGAVSGVGGGIENDGTLTLSNVSVDQNLATGPTIAWGGGIYNSGSLTVALSKITNNTASVNTSAVNAAVQPAGAGIYNTGTGAVTLDRSSVTTNHLVASSTGTGGSTNAFGGGIFNDGTLAVRQSTLNGNTISATGSPVENDGGGGAIAVGNVASPQLTIDRSTLAGNNVTIADPSSVNRGGGILDLSATPIAITSSTITGNDAPVNANLEADPSSTFKNTIVSSAPVGDNCSNAFISLGYNLEDDVSDSCGFSTTKHDIVGQDPMLDPLGLADNGGPTKTIALQTGSPAIDQGLSGKSETTDQRSTGFLRPSDFAATPNATCGDGADIGAFEVQGGSSDRPPGTIVTSHPKGRVHHRTVKFRFHSTEPCSTFQCRLDGKPYSRCHSPTTYHVRRGRHKFRVRAIDVGGAADTTPYLKKFKRV